MERIIDVAQYIFDVYQKLYQENLDEMKLHKLLYLCQRESYAIWNQQMFQENLKGWRYGPISLTVRKFYDAEKGILLHTNTIEDVHKEVIHNVIEEYGNQSSWDLSCLTHQEVSWIKSRKNLKETEVGCTTLCLSDIQEDAKKIRPFDHYWGMYYDEFETYEGEWFD